MTTETQSPRAGDGNLPADRAALVERIKALATEYAERNHGTIFGRLDPLVWCQLTEALDQLAAVPAPAPPPRQSWTGGYDIEGAMGLTG